jgi:endonuclease/exonuclease/phosphatase family metal-dependent hydrolase
LDALKAEDSDIICLQEVWTAQDVEEFKSALADPYPHAFHHRTEDDSGRSVGCGIFDTLKLSGCVSDKCEPQGISAEECVQDPCKDEYDNVGQECQLCLAANTTGPTWCALWPGAKQFAWGGRNGLLMLSKTPLSDLVHTQFDTLLVRRSALSATVGGRRVHCTHLSSDLDVVPYPKGRDMSGWVEELTTQVDVIDGFTPASDCSVLLGDLNMGPASDSTDAPLSAEVPEAWDKLVATGYSETWEDPACTWCQDNPLTDGGAAMQLDHVMTRGCDLQGATYARAMDATIDVTEDRASHETRLSDHYGVRATLTFGAK